jgi:hypothetical protein
MDCSGCKTKTNAQGNPRDAFAASPKWCHTLSLIGVWRASMRKQRPDRHRRKTVTFRIPVHLMEALRELATRNRRTLSREAGLAIKARLSESRPKK